MLRNASPKSGLLMACSFALAIAAGAILLKAQALMGEGFEKALSSQRSELSFQPAAHPVDKIVGDEGYWLTRAEMQSPAVLAKPVVVGDRMTITSADGRERKLEVTDVKAIGSAGRPHTATLLLVTCRLTDEGAEPTQVRFIMEGQPPKALPATTVSKAL